jgi:hypothetical protein
VSLISLENLLKRRSRSASYALKLREYYFYRQVPGATTMMCARRTGLANRFVATSGLYRFVLLNSLVKVTWLFQFAALTLIEVCIQSI